MELSETDKTLNPGALAVLLNLKHHLLGWYLFCDLLIVNDLHWTFLTIIYDPLLVEDLDKTLEAPGERMSPKGDTDPEPCEQEVQGSFSCVDIWIYTRMFTCTALWLSNIKSLLLFRTMRLELHCLTTVRALALSQAWPTKAPCPLTIIAAIWCWVSARLLQPLLMRPSALTHRSWLPWSWSCPRGVGWGLDLSLQDLLDLLLTAQRNHAQLNM